MGIEKVFVIGTGTMGAGICQELIAHDINVMAFSLEEESYVIGKLSKSLSKLVSKGKMTEECMADAMKRFRFTNDIENANEADLVIEAIFEDVELKKKYFKKLDEVCKPDTIIASNTSSVSITELAAATKRPDKVIGMHFFNPVPVMKLVEVVVGYETSDETYNTICSLGERLGKILVKSQDKAGFIVNRVLIPFINEAVILLDEGVASAEEIDNGVKYGCNHPMGPLALADLIGLDVCLAIMEVLYREFADSKYRPSTLLKKMVRAGKLGRKTGIGFYTYN